MHTVPTHKVPTYAHRPSSHPSMVGAPFCAHHTPFPLTFCQFSPTQALPCMFQIWSHHCIWTQLSPTSWSDPASTLASEALLLGGWDTHWRPTTTLQLPPAMFCLCAHAHLHLQCRQENGPICEPPTETNLTAKACHYYHPKISNELTHQNRVLHI